MRVGLEASYAFMGRGGIDRYAHDLFRAILSRKDGHEYVVFSMFAPFRHPGLPERPIQSPLRRKIAMAQVEILRRTWSRFSMPTVERLAGPLDVVHLTHHMVAPTRRAFTVATIHDLSFEYPEFEIENAALYSRDVRRTVQAADLIIAVSEFTRRELEHHYKVPASRVRVVPEGVSMESWHSAKSIEDDRDPFFLAVGKLEVRKNILTLVKALEIVRERYRLPHRLVVVGKLGARGRSLLQGIRKSPVAASIEYRGFVPDHLLRDLYRRATAFVFPSRYEGFGLPILEAMAAGTPVIAADTASVPEVAGDAGLLVDPGDPEGWAEAMARVAEDGRLRMRLADRGRQRAKQFSWDRAAARTVAVYEELAG